MKLITKKLERKLPRLYDTEEEKDPMCHVKLFNPMGAGTWYIIEYDPEEKIAFGYADLNMGFPELGYIGITELENIQLPLGMKIERDLYWEPRPLSEVKKEHEG